MNPHFVTIDPARVAAHLLHALPEPTFTLFAVLLAAPANDNDCPADPAA